METFSALLAICAGNSPVPGEFPAQRPMARGFDIFFDLRPDKRLSEQSRGWWFETQSHSLWRHRNELDLLRHVTYKATMKWLMHWNMMVNHHATPSSHKCHYHQNKGHWKDPNRAPLSCVNNPSAKLGSIQHEFHQSMNRGDMAALNDTRPMVTQQKFSLRIYSYGTSSHEHQSTNVKKQDLVT